MNYPLVGQDLQLLRRAAWNDQLHPGSIGRQPIQDVMFEHEPRCGPFSTVKDFNDWFAALANPLCRNLAEYVDPIRSGLPDHASTGFTHGDLHRSNMIVSRSSDVHPRVRAIIDRHQSGGTQFSGNSAKQLTRWNRVANGLQLCPNVSGLPRRPRALVVFR